MSEILFGQGYSLRLDAKQRRAAQPYAPLATLYAASFLRSRGHSVGLWDAMVSESEEEWAAALDAHRPQVAVLYEDSFNYLTKMCLLRMREAALDRTRVARARGCRVVVGGSDATDHPEAYLAAGASAVVIGEGEATLQDLLDVWLRGSPRGLDAVAGLALPGPGGRGVRTPPRLPLRDLDALPRPAWDLVDVGRYQSAWRSRHGYFSMNLVTTRGCPYHCNWCAKPIYGQRYAVRGAQAVAEEVAWLKEAYGPDHLWFADDIFGLRPGWVEEFASAVRTLGAAVPFKCLSRADLLGASVVAALKSAGCRTVWLGAESGSQKILDAMDKGQTVGQVRDAARRLHEAGIEVGFFIQFGYPDEGWREIEETLRLVRECAPDDIGVSVSYPLPGTRFHARVREDLGGRRNWTESDDLAMLYRGPFGTDFYRRLHRVVHAEFRLRRLVRGRGTSLRHAASALGHAVTLPLERWRLRRVAAAGTP
jgi:anaerobic magnesium-protoporphyrin IX monomethyl ester cyclase